MQMTIMHTYIDVSINHYINLFSAVLEVPLGDLYRINPVVCPFFFRQSVSVIPETKHIIFLSWTSLFRQSILGNCLPSVPTYMYYSYTYTEYTQNIYQAYYILKV